LPSTTLTRTSSSQGSAPDLADVRTHSTGESSDVLPHSLPSANRSLEGDPKFLGARMSSAWFPGNESSDQQGLSENREGFSNPSGQVRFESLHFFHPFSGICIEVDSR
jgi:hypothetical protein